MSEATITRATTPMTELLFLHAQTSLHPGSGTALGVVDLPIQRERHTQWPVIPGTSLKGILRDACRERAKQQYQDEYEEGAGKPKLKRSQRQVANEDDPFLVAVFGPGKVDENTSHAGALSLTDARILAFPVRSLRGVFAWVTCRAVLERLHRDLKLGVTNVGQLMLPSAPARDKALCPSDKSLLVDDKNLVLEEFEFERTGDAGMVTEWIAKHAVRDDFTSQRLKRQLVILHDDDFTHFVRHATEIVARVGLNYEKKTVRTGALFYQECLPPETLFYSVVFANRSRHQGHKKEANEIMDYLRRNLPPQTVLQIGGDETTGKGLCAVRLSNTNGGAQ